MIKIEQIDENEIVKVKASGTLTKEDYDQVVPELEKIMKEHKKVKFFVKLDHLEGMKWDAIKEELKFDRKYKEFFGKTAVVGEKKWQKWGTNISNLFFGSEIKFFYEDQTEEALDWLKAA
ncbi:MAG: hypothetical protein Tsb0021_07060 [Chlamydiales bacterium]